jgi:purine-binding chemotaxis protein CheW
MVDLVKIRKKAKKGDAAPRADESAPREAGPRAEESGPSAEGRESREKTADRSKSEPRAKKKTTSKEPETGSEAQTLDPRPATLGPGSPTLGPESKLDRFKSEAGKRRAVDEAAETDEGPGEGQVELLTFAIAGEQYAVDIEQIVEIVTPRPVTRIPNTDSSVVGIMSLRGTIVTLVDVRKKLRHRGGSPGGEEVRVIVVDLRNETIGFEVDRVLRVVKAAADEVQPHPVVHAAELDESIRGVFRVAGALTILLDLDKLLDQRALAATTA